MAAVVDRLVIKSEWYDLWLTLSDGTRRYRRWTGTHYDYVDLKPSKTL